MMGCEAWPTPRHTPLPMCYLAERGRSALKCVGIEENSRIGYLLGSAPLGCERGWPPKQAPSPYVLPHQIWSFCIKDVCINRKEPPKRCSGARLTPRNMPRAPHMCYPAEFSQSRSNRVSIIKEIAWKIWHLMFCFLRSLKVVGTNMDWLATFDFQLTFHSNHGTISYHFRNKWQFWSKIAIFRTPLYLTPLLSGFLELGNTRRPQESQNDGATRPTAYT